MFDGLEEEPKEPLQGRKKKGLRIKVRRGVRSNAYVEAINRALENIDLARQRMANDQIEIDRLRVETRQMIAELLT